MNRFWEEIQRRNGIKCKSYWLRGEWADDLIFALLAKEWDPAARTR